MYKDVMHKYPKVLYDSMKDVCHVIFAPFDQKNVDDNIIYFQNTSYNVTTYRYIADRSLVSITINNLKEFEKNHTKPVFPQDAITKMKNLNMYPYLAENYNIYI